jgi:tetratricopeptide (TPR) repeat protein
VHPALVFTARYGPPLAAWLLTHRHELGEAYDGIAGRVSDALAGRASVDRVGKTLVAVRDGQTEVLGLLHRHTTKLDNLQAGIDGLWAGQQAVAGAVDLLTALSAVGLGVSVLSHVALGFQLNAINRRLGQLAVAVQQVKALLDAQHKAALAAGIAQLQKGVAVGRADESARLFEDAASKLTDSSANFAEQVQTHLRAGEASYVWVLARHLLVSALGEAAAHLRLGQREAAVLSLDKALPALRAHARRVFERTVGADPAALLMPALAEHGITLEAVAELYRQAGLAGATDGGPVSAADMFERLRGKLPSASDPLFFRERRVRQLRAAFAEATAAVEEVNRVQGVKLAIQAYHTPDRTYDALADELLRQTEVTAPPDGAVLAFFPPRSGNGGAVGDTPPS